MTVSWSPLLPTADCDLHIDGGREAEEAAAFNLEKGTAETAFLFSTRSSTSHRRPPIISTPSFLACPPIRYSYACCPDECKLEPHNSYAKPRCVITQPATQLSSLDLMYKQRILEKSVCSLPRGRRASMGRDRSHAFPTNSTCFLP